MTDICLDLHLCRYTQFFGSMDWHLCRYTQYFGGLGLHFCRYTRYFGSIDLQIYRYTRCFCKRNRVSHAIRGQIEESLNRNAVKHDQIRQTLNAIRDEAW